MNWLALVQWTLIWDYHLLSCSMQTITLFVDLLCIMAIYCYSHSIISKWKAKNQNNNKSKSIEWSSNVQMEST